MSDYITTYHDWEFFQSWLFKASDRVLIESNQNRLTNWSCNSYWSVCMKKYSSVTLPYLYCTISNEKQISNHKVYWSRKTKTDDYVMQTELKLWNWFDVYFKLSLCHQHTLLLESHTALGNSVRRVKGQVSYIAKKLYSTLHI